MIIPSWIPNDVIWKNKKELYVKFLNEIPPNWIYSGHDLDIETIKTWILEWNPEVDSIIPHFVFVDEYHAIHSDIRVKFTSKSVSSYYTTQCNIIL